MAEKSFKVWASNIQNEQTFQPLTDVQIGQMVRLGIHTANKGKQGAVKFKSLDRMAKFFNVMTILEAADIINKLPVTMVVADTGDVTVTFKNWEKDQGDPAKKPRKAKTEVSPEEKALKAKARDIIGRYCELFEKEYNERPVITGANAGAALRLAKLMESGRDIIGALDKFFTSNIAFIKRTRHAFNVIESQLNSLLIHVDEEDEVTVPYHTDFHQAAHR